MAQLIDEVVNSTIFLFHEDGSSPIGTAFIVGVPLPSDQTKYVPFIVTAKHVVSNQKKIIGRFNSKNGSTVSVPYDLDLLKNTNDLWEHPDKGVDLVVFRTLHFNETQYYHIPSTLIASKDTFSKQDIKPSDQIVFPCLLVNFMGASKNYPILRNGSIALIPEEPVPITCEYGSGEFLSYQEMILIDATSIKGASGAPIFLWPGIRLKGTSFHLGGSQIWLLGIMKGFYFAPPQKIDVIPTSRSIPVYQENSGIALITPSWKLQDIFDSTEFQQKILTLDEEIKKS